MDENNIVLAKSKKFAVRIVNLYKYLRYTKNEYTLADQILRAGTSVGANICEAVRGFSKSDFLYKMNTALKEAYEAEFWLEVLYETEYITENEFKSIYSDCVELAKLLTVIVKSSRDFENT